MSAYLNLVGFSRLPELKFNLLSHVAIIILLLVPFTTFCTAQDDQNDSLWNVYRTPGTPHAQ
ncbi:MAG: hypothetical protein IPI00_00725 [Flavobacteriales bacterium]|nr:hypothetical protein [Flavobacteriales bacterium]